MHALDFGRGFRGMHVARLHFNTQIFALTCGDCQRRRQARIMTVCLQRHPVFARDSALQGFCCSIFWRLHRMCLAIRSPSCGLSMLMHSLGLGLHKAHRQ
eukprot:TRINITY_DN16712_c0_g1_i2.p1 TRINITY_DN16712_c0_g1~~TRINITY_DN16712_c0_g1_i2.p1  ORF type:complete len:100 (+),score=1.99 TRINITY_DN16712_c0_g1_i2:325-624(+)